VTSMVPPNMVMPKLIDRSERQAKLLIDSYGLKLGKVTTKNADCNGCVVEQYVEGKLIEPGQIIRKGSKIDLVIGVKEYYAPASIDTLAGQTPTAGLDFDDGE
ncbi:MAG: PASTA domain-containing protein, partial [Bacteroidia bacterium]